MNFNFARQINWSSLAFKANLIKWSMPTLANCRKWSLLGFQTLQSEDNGHHQSLPDLVSANLRKNDHHGSYLCKTKKMVITSLSKPQKMVITSLSKPQNWSLPGLFILRSKENGHHKP
jgi:hypothetical protein